MDILVPDEGKCLLCGLPCSNHCGGDYDASVCYEGLQVLARAIEEIRLYVKHPDSVDMNAEENLNVIVKVRKRRIVEADVRIAKRIRL